MCLYTDLCIFACIQMYTYLNVKIFSLYSPSHSQACFDSFQNGPYTIPQLVVLYLFYIYTLTITDTFSFVLEWTQQDIEVLRTDADVYIYTHIYIYIYTRIYIYTNIHMYICVSTHCPSFQWTQKTYPQTHFLFLFGLLLSRMDKARHQSCSGPVFAVVRCGQGI